MYRRMVPFVMLVLALSLVVTGCGPGTGQTGGGVATKPKKGGQIVYGLTGDPVIFNPILSTDSPSNFVIGRIFNGLVRANEKLELVPDLAEKWETSEDGLVWTFHLKKNVPMAGRYQVHIGWREVHL